METFKPSNTNAIGVTNVSSARTLPSNRGSSAWFYNADAANIIYIATGPSTLTVAAPVVNLAVGAEANGVPVHPGQRIHLSIPAGHTHWGAIAAVAGPLSMFCTAGEGAS